MVILSRALPVRIAQGKSLDAAVDDRPEPLDRPVELEALDATEQMCEHELDLDAREVRADAEVLTETERDVRIRRSIDSERERVVEHGLVTVRRRVVERDAVTGPDAPAA